MGTRIRRAIRLQLSVCLETLVSATSFPKQLIDSGDYLVRPNGLQPRVGLGNVTVAVHAFRARSTTLRVRIRAIAFRACRTEQRNDRHAERCCQMHGAGISADEQLPRAGSRRLARRFDLAGVAVSLLADRTASGSASSPGPWLTITDMPRSAKARATAPNDSAGQRFAPQPAPGFTMASGFRLLPHKAGRLGPRRQDLQERAAQCRTTRHLPRRTPSPKRLDDMALGRSDLSRIKHAGRRLARFGRTNARLCAGNSRYRRRTHCSLQVER